jgi:hypothetical protein
VGPPYEVRRLWRRLPVESIPIASVVSGAARGDQRAGTLWWF